MQNYILSATSTADLSKEHFESRGIHYLCFHFTMDGVEHIDDLGQSMSFDEFYHQMEEGVVTKTSQPSTGQFLEYFTPFLEQGKDILHVSLSSGLSGEFNNASLAARTLMDKFPERKIIVIDSLGASSGYGLFVNKLADLRDEGM
ncbi:MAG: DegV family protein, partial [Candidatus Enteromonas sp.]